MTYIFTHNCGNYSIESNGFLKLCSEEVTTLSPAATEWLTYILAILIVVFLFWIVFTLTSK